MPTLLWFRRDLRLHDLPALVDAAQGDGQVLACYVLDPRLHRSAGPRRLQYLHDALRDLRDQLDGRLLVTRGRPEQRIPALAKSIDASAVYVSGDFTPFGRRRDDAVRKALGEVPPTVRFALSGVAGPGHQGRRDAVQGVQPVLRRLAQTRLARAGTERAGFGDVDRPGGSDGPRSADRDPRRRRHPGHPRG